MTSHVSFTGMASWFLAGGFIREAPPSRDIGFVTLVATYKF